ncbi:hypothetical protein PIB30_066086 [Stylosanthes scabra]|uniref:DNA polymerase n=1 Tax=Stylosanthes scabra TaxID=79078 RepID=A0ABU6YKX8_9FABA|nr:hypothetical protein [Stylosanthes scabra]
MSDEEAAATTAGAGRRRTRGPTSSARSEALERLKARIRGGPRSDGATPQIRLENPIYDTVEEEEYNALVAQRREQARAFIVDDDGLGYGDEGEEEDWSKAGYSLSSDESDGAENEGRPKRKKIEKKEHNPNHKRTSAALSAAAVGAQRLSSMFTSSTFKKSRDDKVPDSIVDDVLAEFAADETDRERRRRSHPKAISNSNSNLSSATNDAPRVNCVFGSSNSSIAGASDLMRGSSLLKTAVNCDVESVRVVSNDVSDLGSEQKKCETVKENELSIEGSDIGNVFSSENGGASFEQVPSNGNVGEEEPLKDSTVLEKPVAVKKELFSFNAKLKDEKEDPALSATAGWQAVRNGGAANVSVSDSKEHSEFNLEEDGSLPFYILDAYEEFNGANRGTLYLFGKVKAGNSYQSCCVVVKNMQRCVYAIPSHPIHLTDEMVKLEKDVQKSADFHKKLQDAVSDLKNELANHLLNLNVSGFSMAPVKRKYAFERLEIPSGENYVLKISYPFKDPVLPADLKGENFSALLGTHYSALELFLVKRKIKGPSWLQVSNFSSCPTSERERFVSWCKFEVIVDSPKDIRVSTSSKITFEIPPAVVTAINLKTTINEKQNVNEIVSASIVSCYMVKIDTPMLASEWKRPGMLTHFTVIRKIDGNIFPLGFSKEVTDRNSKSGSNVLCVESSERALLNRLMTELHKLDSDVLVGHNISGFDLEVLLHRSQACKVPSNMWSKLGRLKRSALPRLDRGSKAFGSGARPAIMSCMSGRLLCDTFLCSRDLLKEVSYSLTELTKTQLKKSRKEIAPHDVPKKFQSTESLIELGARAQRVEFLLLHAFHAKKYMVPDKIPNYEKETKLTKRKVAHGIEDSNLEEADGGEANYDNDAADTDNKKSKKAPSYAGGLVLEPKKGLYDKYILLLDFNSLYPSIIQEYNICFTTVERSQGTSFSRLPSSLENGVLPELLKNLVERRRLVKKWMKKASGLKVQQLDIQQQALKLTANSMYGCLGFSNSRFYAKPIAELITLQGREILQSTVDLVQNNLNLEVIYGDTDSIMIYSGLDDIAKAKAMASKVIQEVNKKYRCLEIDLDGLYKRMLLLKKKKYAAVKVQFNDDAPYEVIERKGLDIVRRDWSLLAKELGDFCLTQILSGGSCEDVVESIHSYLRQEQEKMRSGQVSLEKYVINKTLTKPPEAYPDAKNQPHVLVAQRMKQQGYSSGCSVGDTIPYIICCEEGCSSGSATGIAQRARHPDELKQEQGKWLIDIEYYLSQQIHPVISRLCASIQGTSPERLADCLGLDSSKFQHKSSEAPSSDPSSSLLFAADDEERYRECESLVLCCRSCSDSFECPPVFKSICLLGSEKITSAGTEEPSYNFWRKLRCPKCPEDGIERISPAMLTNQVKMQAEKFVLMYYRGLLMCDDETCKHTTRSINLKLYTEADLYKQLSYFCHVLDTFCNMEKMEVKSRIPIEKELIKIRPMVDQAASSVQKLRDRCAYGWVKLQDFVVSV